MRRSDCPDLTPDPVTTRIRRLAAAMWMLIVTYALHAQTDTLHIVRQLNKNKQYTRALNLLDAYNRHHRGDLTGAWLRAQTLHLAGDFTGAQRAYYTLENKHPYNYDIKLDRINKVIDHGDIGSAIQQLRRLAPQLPKDYYFVAHRTLAQLFYWKGEYDKAYKEIKTALHVYPADKKALQIRAGIQRARSHWTDVRIAIQKDDQPLSAFRSELETGFYIHSHLTAGVLLSLPAFGYDDHRLSVPQGGAFGIFNFTNTGTQVRLDAGLAAFREKTEWTGGISITQRLSDVVRARAAIARLPYLTTTLAIPAALMQNQTDLQVVYDKPNGFTGKLLYRANRFAALDNGFFTIGGWLVSPGLLPDDFQIRLGYGFGYSDSKANTFRATESVDSIAANWDSTAVIPGVYDPFFSPHRQMVHTAVAAMQYQINPGLKAGLNLNYGFYARTDAPHLFPGEGDDGLLSIERGFHKATYHPFDWAGYVYYELSDRLSLKAFYKYQRTFYYKSHYFGMTGHYLFGR